MNAPIRIEEKYSGEVIELQLNTPPGNILDTSMITALTDAVRKTADAKACKLVMFTASGQHFCYGASIEEHARDKVGEMLPVFHRFIDSVLRLPVPTMAVVQGVCLGGGFELAMACTFVFADEGAKFAVPEISLGVFPPVACAILSQRCPSNIAAELILTGEKIGATELRHYGMLNHVAKNGSLSADVASFIEKKILPKSASSLSIAYRALQQSRLTTYGATIRQLEAMYLNELMRTHDATEGIRSFIDKRKPQWRNA